jgi:hypothetical protein
MQPQLPPEEPPMTEGNKTTVDIVPSSESIYPVLIFAVAVVVAIVAIIASLKKFGIPKILKMHARHSDMSSIAAEKTICTGEEFTQNNFTPSS